MALFPAGKPHQDTTQGSPQGTSWLQNPSFDSALLHTSTSLTPSHASTSSPSSESSPESKHSSTKRNKKAKNVKQKRASSPKRVKPNTLWLDECGLAPKDAFHVDPNPDRSNLSYDSLYSGSVAVYRRRFSVLGLRPQQSVVLDDGRSKQSKKRDKKKSGQVRYFAAELSASEEVVLHSETSTPLGDVLRFGESSTLTCESYSSQRVGEYNKTLMDDPHNVPLWLEFISSQDSLLDWAQGGKKGKAMAERKVAIYERALQSNPNSVELLLGHMSLVAQYWEPKAVMKRWKELVFKLPNVPRLWLGYIDFCQANFTEFTTDSVAALYAKCVSTLSMINEGTLKSHSPLPDSHLWTLTIFSKYCDFLQQSGYSERAVASYQALLELNLCRPPELVDAPLSSLVVNLRQFWESASPKLGEEEAHGWMNWNTPTKLGPLDVALTSDPSPEEDDFELVSGLSLKEAWLKLEDHRTKEHCLPWVGTEDPLDTERIVSFDTIKPTLFRLEDPDLKLQLVLRFLNFLGALTPPLDTPPSHSSPETPPSHSSPDTPPSHSSPDTPPSHSSPGTPSHTRAIEHPLELSSHFVEVFGCLLLERVHVSSGIGLVHPSLVFKSIGELINSLSNTLLHTPKLTKSFVSQTVSRLCHQTLSLLPQEHAQTVVALVWVTHTLRELAVSLQSEESGKEVKEKKKNVSKLVKSLLKLKSHRNNLELWNCCALVEHLLGNDCLHIYHTLLSSSLTAPLCVSMVECSLSLVPSLSHREEATDKSQLALNALLSLCEGKYNHDSPITPVRMLKANFSNLPSHSLLDVFYTGLCRAYFEYLTKGVAPASKVVDELCQSLSSHAELVERLRFKQVRLLRHSPLSQPKAIKIVLEASLLSSPANPWLLANQLILEEQSFSVGRIHRDPIKCPEAQLFGVLRELRRYERTAQVTGTPHGALRRAQALLETAVEEEGQSPLLWRLYMSIQALVDPDRLDALFYRAIHACPWSKALYEDGARFLPESKLARVVEVMEDKGIRLHAPIEEIQLLLD